MTEPACETPLPTVLLRSVLWRRRDEPSFELARFREYHDGFILEGRVLTVFGDEPCEVHYSVWCGLDWSTRGADVFVMDGREPRRLVLRRDDEDHWWREGTHHLPELDGLRDIDLAVSPATNTLAIRRLALQPGESAGAEAAWVRFPELTLERIPQRYTRTSERHYHYESGDFAADLEVDDQGVVIHYGELWERVAP